MNKSFVRIKRSILHNDLWLSRDTKSIREAFLDILLSVNNEPKPVFINNKRFECGRFQSLKSVATWAGRWNCERYKAYRYLKRLEKLKYIRIENMKYTIRITVLEVQRFFYLGSDGYSERCNSFATPENGKVQQITGLKQESSSKPCNSKKNESAPKQVKDTMYKGKILEENFSSLNSSLNEIEKEKIISDFEKNEKKISEKNTNQGKLFKGTGLSPAEHERRMIEIRENPFKI